MNLIFAFLKSFSIQLSAVQAWSRSTLFGFTTGLETNWYSSSLIWIYTIWFFDWIRNETGTVQACMGSILFGFLILLGEKSSSLFSNVKILQNISEDTCK